VGEAQPVRPRRHVLRPDDRRSEDADRLYVLNVYPMTSTTAARRSSGCAEVDARRSSRLYVDPNNPNYLLAGATAACMRVYDRAANWRHIPTCGHAVLRRRLRRVGAVLQRLRRHAGNNTVGARAQPKASTPSQRRLVLCTAATASTARSIPRIRTSSTAKRSTATSSASTANRRGGRHPSSSTTARSRCLNWDSRCC